MTDEPDLATSIRTGAEWIAQALSDLAGLIPNPYQGEGLEEVARAITRLAAAQERQAAALERLATVMEKKK
jgi:methyl-accepting chemotaxis protein